MKKCNKCGEVKSATEFGKDARSRDGLQCYCKDCRRSYRSVNKDKLAVYSKVYYAKHRTERLASSKEWALAHKEERAAYGKRYYAERRDEKIAYAKAYNIAHQEKIISYGVVYRQEHRERLKSYRSTRYDEHRDEMQAYGRMNASRRRTRENGAEGYADVNQVRARWEYYGNRCYICGVEAEATDHVIPLAKGGSNWPANLRPICNRCNSVKGAKWPYDFGLTL